MDTAWKDLRFALRTLLRRPLLTGVSVFTLALGIGASTAIYSVVQGVLLEPLPYRQPDRLAMIWTRFDGQGVARAPVSGPELVDFRRESALFEDFAGIWQRFGSLGGNSDPEQIHIGWVSGNFFDVLGASPLLGRTFLPEEDVPDGSEVILLSYEVWQRRYGGDESLVGRTVEFNNAPFTVVGVMPPGFAVTLPPDAGMPRFGAWLPWQGEYSEMRRNWRMFRCIARLAPGAAFEPARREMEMVAARLDESHVAYGESGFAVEVRPLHGDVVATVRPALMALLGAVGFLTLIACANVANLLLVRAAAREQEMALRSALGASRARVLRQLLTESLLLFLAGGAAGLLVAGGALKLLVVLRPAGLPRLDTVGLDPSALGFNFLATLFTGLVFGSLPAWQATRGDLTRSLKDGGRGLAGGVRQRLRHLLVVAEVALSVMLLVGAGLMVRSLAALGDVPLGFRSEGVLTARMSLPFTSHPYSEPTKIAAFYQQLMDRLADRPGVDAVGTTNYPPLSGASSGGEPYAFETPAGTSEWGTRSADYRVVTSDFFRTMGTRLLAGRFFDRRDDRDHPTVVVIDRKLATIAWPEENPVGQRLKVNLFLNGHSEPTWAEVVGVVDSIRNVHAALDEREQVYLSHLQTPRRSMTLAVRGSLDQATLAEAVRQEVRTLDPSRPVFDVRPLAAYEADAVSQSRLVLMLLGAFAVLAAVLAAVGLYGVIADLVRQSTREIGVRMALGARDSQIFFQVLGHGLALAGVGVGVGLGLALVTGRVMASLVFGVGARDAVTFTVVAALSLVVAAAAAYLPVRSATRVDPMKALTALQ